MRHRPPIEVPPAQAERERQELLRLAGSLRAARERAGVSLRDVEQATGYSRPAVSNWERARFPPPVMAVIRLAHLYRTSLAALFNSSTRPARARKRG